MMHLLRSSHLFTLPIAFALYVIVPAIASADPIAVEWNELRDVENEPLGLRDAKLKVVCFLGTECPLARLYGPRLQRLADEFSARGVRLIGVNSNRQDSVAEIKQYANEHKLSFPMIKDESQSLARKFGATRTPEVFVLDGEDRVRYQGRIDDQFEPGVARSAPTRRHLHGAVEALVAGRPAPETKTEAVGCLITFVKQTKATPVDASDAVTFSRDVAPILNRHCVECHRQGEIGPFALTDYDEVVGWAEMMLEVIEQKRMPPWHADPRHGKFVGERRMPQQAYKTLAAWVEQGMPQGDGDDLPPKPNWAGGWHLPTPPDVELAMRERPFLVPADGTVEYQYFVVDPKWEEDRWVRAAQVIPGDASVVHHSIVFVRPPDGADTEGIGWLGGYVPGQRVGSLPSGHARRIPARSKLVFQMHYTPNGRATEDVTKVGVWFIDADEVTHEVTSRVSLNQSFEIPPGAKDFAVDLRLDDFARHSRLLGVMPHMHLRGKSFRLHAKRDDKTETLLYVPHYDFNWQHWYQFETPLALNKIDALQMQARFDNSAANPFNPDPQRFVTWGDQTWQEMAVAFFDVAHPIDKPREIARRSNKKSKLDEAERQRRIDEKVEKFLAQLDQNGDGVVEREEAPDGFRRFGFRKFDANDDDRLQRSEIEKQARRRL